MHMVNLSIANEVLECTSNGFGVWRTWGYIIYRYRCEYTNCSNHI